MLKVKKESFAQILVKPFVNKSNGQMNFSIKKKSLPKDIQDKLPQLKSIKLRAEDFGF